MIFSKINKSKNCKISILQQKACHNFQIWLNITNTIHKNQSFSSRISFNCSTNINKKEKLWNIID